PHRLAGSRRIAAADRVVDAPVFVLDALQVSLQFPGTLQPDAYALARDEETPEVLEKAAELRIVRRLGDRLVKAEVFVDGRVPALERAIEGGERAPDPLPARRTRALRRQAGGLDFDAGAKLHHAEHVRDRAHVGGIDAERTALRVAIDERTHSLPRLD